MENLACMESKTHCTQCMGSRVINVFNESGVYLATLNFFLVSRFISINSIVGWVNSKFDSIKDIYAANESLHQRKLTTSGKDRPCKRNRAILSKKDKCCTLPCRTHCELL